MKVKQTLLTLGLLVGAFGGNFALVSSAHAAELECGNAKTSIISCKADKDTTNGKVENNAIWKLLIMVLNIMIAGVGVLAVAGIVWGSVLYASAGDRPEQTKKAKEIIFNVVLGLLAFGLMYSVLNFLIPGGVFN
jgi:hypothetical protein